MLETQLLIPVLILLGISFAISLLVSSLKIHFLPTFIIEVIVGMALGPVLVKYLTNHNFQEITDFLYVVGFSFIMFLSGFDGDLQMFKQLRQKSKFNVARLSVMMLLLVYLASIVVSLFFLKSFEKVLLGIILLTITFSSTFAGVVAPLVHVESLGHTNWGKMIINYSFLSELTSVIFLTVYMLTQTESANYLSYLVIIVIFAVIFFVLKLRRGRRVEEGMVFFSTRLVLVALAACVLLGEQGGGEYVLGAFLLGFFLKAAGFAEHRMKILEGMGYGLFIPVFFIILGTRIDIMHFIHHPQLILTAVLLFLAFLVVKLPFLLLLKWYQFKTVYTSVALVTSTLVVAVTAEHLGTHFGIFSEDFGKALILASLLTTIFGTLIFEINCFGPLRTLRTEEKGIVYDEINEIS